MAVDGVPDDTSRRRPRVLVVGAGFAGFHCLPDAGEPAAAGGRPTGRGEPRGLHALRAAAARGRGGDPGAAPSHGAAARARCPTYPGPALGDVAAIDLAARTCTLVDVERRSRTLTWDTTGWSWPAARVTRLLSVPGVTDHAHRLQVVARGRVPARSRHAPARAGRAGRPTPPSGRRGPPSSSWAPGTPGPRWPPRASCLTESLGGVTSRRCRPARCAGCCSISPPGCCRAQPRLSAPALRVLRRRGVDVRTRDHAQRGPPATCVRLADGTEIPTRTVVWCVGVRPIRWWTAVGLPTREGRVVVDERLGVSGHRDVYAAGDVAAVPDPSRPGEITTMTAQHARGRADWPRSTSPHRSGTGCPTATDTRTGDSWSISAARRPSPTPSTCVSRARWPRPSPAATTWRPCRPGGPGWPRTG